MSSSQANTLDYYEGLVRATAGRYESIMAGAAMDFDDICQVLRVAVWKALSAFDERKATQPIHGYVFMCVRNRAKDLVKYRTPEHMARDPLLIEDVAPTVNGNGVIRDAFELRYLSADEEQAFMSVLEEPPLVPSTLTSNERRVLKLMYHDYRQVEIAPILDLSPDQVKAAVKGIREKMADWCPEEPTAVARSAA
jgi:RNA polymerase sigma factor (sigma-70 family)